MDTLFANVVALYKEFDVSFTDALSLITVNPAKALMLDHKKGRIQKDYNADLVLLDQDLKIQSVYARGRLMMKDQEMIVQPYYR